LGLQIIRTLVSSDLEGEFELLHGPEWTTARVRFPHRISDKV
jgi:two-component sensor histidine kinase